MEREDRVKRRTSSSGPEEEAQAKIWPPPVRAGNSLKPPNLQAERRRGAAGLIVSLLRLFAPVGVFAVVNAAENARDDLAWEEGGGFFALMFCLLVVFVSQLIALRQGLGSRRTVTGKAAAGAAAAILGGLAVFCVWVFVSSMRR